MNMDKVEKMLPKSKKIEKWYHKMAKTHFDHTKNPDSCDGTGTFSFLTAFSIGQ